MTLSVPSQAVRFHDELARAWESKYRKASFQARNDVLELLLAGRKLRHTTWLDAGCGSGTQARRLAAEGARVTGIDASQRMIEWACESSKQANLPGPADFSQVETIERLELPDNHFDGVLCSSVLEYVTNPDAALSEMVRVLRPGGVLLISVPNRRSLVRRSLESAYAGTRRWGWGRPWPAWMEHSRNAYRRGEFRKLLLERGMRVERQIYFGGPVPGLLARARLVGSLIFFEAVKLVRSRGGGFETVPHH